MGPNAGGLRIGAIGKIETAQAVIGGGQADPGLGVARVQFHRPAEMPLRQAVAALAEILLGDVQLIVGIGAQQLRGRRRRVGRRLVLGRGQRGVDPVAVGSAAVASPLGPMALASELNGFDPLDVVSQPASHVKQAKATRIRLTFVRITHPGVAPKLGHES